MNKKLLLLSVLVIIIPTTIYNVSGSVPWDYSQPLEPPLPPDSPYQQTTTQQTTTTTTTTEQVGGIPWFVWAIVIGFVMFGVFLYRSTQKNHRKMR